MLVSLGGDIATAGPAPEGGWQVIVQDLPDDVPQQITLAAGAGVATSSSAKRTWTQDGARVTTSSTRARGFPPTVPGAASPSSPRPASRANIATHRRHGQGRRRLAWLRATGLPARLVAPQGALVTLSGWPREEAA